MATNVGAKKRAGIVLIILGVFFFVVALVPNAVGIASDGFSAARWVLLAFGLLVVLVGAMLTRKKGHTRSPSV